MVSSLPATLAGLGPVQLGVPAPSTPLGSFEDSAVSWSSWTTLMAFVGLVMLAVLVARPARALGTQGSATVRTRLSWSAVLAGLLAFPAVLTDLAHDGSSYDYSAAWTSLFDGTARGLLDGFEALLPLVGVLLLLPVALGRPSSALSPRCSAWLRSIALLCGAVALGSTKFPSKAPANWGRTTFETLMWMLHLLGGGVWLGGLIGLVVLSVRGGLGSAFWSLAIRRFSVAAMSCVAAIGLSGLFLYWEHVDGLSQLFTTMYGRVLGVKIILFGGLMLLGAFNQFWLHPRIDALRAGGDERPLRTVLLRQFPAVVATEVLLALLLLFVAPFLHGSARNQAFQADAAKRATAPIKKLPKLPAKEVSASTWVEGTAETVAVLVIMIGGYRYSGRLARRRAGSAVASSGPVLVPSARVADGAPVTSGTFPIAAPTNAPTTLDAPTEPAAL